MLPTDKFHPGWRKFLVPGNIFCFGPYISGSKLPRPGKNLLEDLRKSGIRIHVLVVPKNNPNGLQLLKNPAISGQWTDAIVAEFTGFDGIQADFENFPPHYHYAYKALLKQLKKKMNPEQSLGAAVFPPVDFNPQASAFHHHTSLADSIDYVVLMAYDYRGRGTENGPVSSLPWIKENLNALIRTTPRNKIWLGLPWYGYGRIDGKTVFLTGKTNFARINRHTPSGMLSVRFRIRGKSGSGFYPDEKFLESAREEVLKSGIAGSAYWRYGFQSGD